MRAKIWTYREFARMLEKNGYTFIRNSAGHKIYKNKEGREITIKENLNPMIARRLIKENSLIF